MSKKKLPNIQSKWKSIIKGQGLPIRDRYYSLREITDDKGVNFCDFFNVDKFTDINYLIDDSYKNEDIIRNVIKKSRLIKKYTDTDSLTYVVEYVENVERDLKLLEENSEKLVDVYTSLENSYSDLKKLFIDVLEYEDIDLSKYSKNFTSKDRDIQLRKRKIDSILDENSDDVS